MGVKNYQREGEEIRPKKRRWNERERVQRNKGFE